MQRMMVMGKMMRALGLMSGTSMDGIDVALIETDGEDVVKRGPSMTFPYSAETRQRLTVGLSDARTIENRVERPGNLRALEVEITELHAAAVNAFRRKQGIGRADIDVVGFHGHTVLHRPPRVSISTSEHGVPYEVAERGMTVQLGSGMGLADLIALDVVHDMRAADVEAGGQGAPLVPVYHRALAASLPQRPLAIVNIGGVANVTVIDREGDLSAFDTGPGNALVDDWMLKRMGVAFDANGQVAAAGTVNEDVLRFYLSHTFFAALPPKSLDRSAFFSDLVDWMTTQDGAATLTAFTAGAIARAREHMHEEPALWVIAGGGRKNPTLMRMIAARVENAVVPAEAVSLAGDAMEAEAWAYLAVRSLRGLPLTFPATTGVVTPTMGGVLTRAPRAAG
jgi:anhydro-N-acetylmuramic acid kinase